jgi:glutamyl-tRNA synthetase
VIAPHIQERCKLITDAAAMADFLFRGKIEREIPAMLKQGIDAAKAKEILQGAHEALKDVSDFTPAAIEPRLHALVERLALKVGPVFSVLRIAVTGRKVSPPLFESMAALGREETVKRFMETVGEL